MSPMLLELERGTETPPPGAGLSEHSLPTPEALVAPPSDLETASEVFGMIGREEKAPGGPDAVVGALVKDTGDFFRRGQTSEALRRAKVGAVVGGFQILEGEDFDDTALALSEIPHEPLEAALTEIGEADPSGEAVEEITRAIDEAAGNSHEPPTPEVAHDDEKEKCYIEKSFNEVLKHGWAYGNAKVELQRLQEAPDEMSEDEVRLAALSLRTMREVQSRYRSNIVGINTLDTLALRAAAYEGPPSTAVTFGRGLLSDRPDAEEAIANTLLWSSAINEATAARVVEIARANENEARQQFAATDFTQLGKTLGLDGNGLQGQLWDTAPDRRQTLAQVAEFASAEVPSGLKDKVTKLLFPGDSIRLDYLPQLEAALNGGLAKGLSGFEAVTGKDMSGKYVESLRVSDRDAARALIGNLKATELQEYFSPDKEDNGHEAFSQKYREMLVNCVTQDMTEAGSVASKVGEIKGLEANGIEKVLAEPAFNGTEHELIRAILKSEDVPESYDKLRDLIGNGFMGRLLSDDSLGRKTGADIASHLVDWTRLAQNIPDMPDRHVGSYVFNRLQMKSPVESMVDSVGALQSFTMPEAYSDEVNRNKSLQFIQSVLGRESVDKLPTNASKLRLLIEDEDLRAVYLHIVGTKASSPDMSPDEILRSGKEQGIFDDAIMAELRDESLQDGSERKDATGLLSELRTVSGKRKLIKEARARWLGEGAKNGMMTSNLALAWSYREDALAEGTPDIPNEILSWAAENMFEKYVRKKQAEDPSGRIPSEAERIEYKPLTSELVRRYSPEASLQAFVRYKAAAESGFNGPPELKAGKTEVTMDDGSSYSFELLEKSDPRGFTIGVDTGCCMKLGGQAESCVWAGFEDPSFGFIAVYKDGKLRGQSVVYVGDKTGEGDKDTLVIDNIEANKGTDMVNLTAVYQQGVRQLLDQGALSPSIKQINLGTGNSDVDYGHLEVTEPVLHNKPVYTDAERQRLLMSV